jgi:hypothetical protein
MANNTQLTRAIMRTDMAPAIIGAQNAPPYGSLKVARPWQTPKLNGHYRTLRGDFRLPADSEEAKPVAFGAPPTRSNMSYGKQDYDVFIHRHSQLDFDRVLEHDLAADDLDTVDDYIRMHVPRAMQIHAEKLAARFSSTGADRAFPAGMTLSSITLTPTYDLLKLMDDIDQKFREEGAYGPAETIDVFVNNKVASAMKRNLSVSGSNGIASAEGGVARLGANTLRELEQALNDKTDFPVPVRLIVDGQSNLAGTPIFADDIYVVIQGPTPRHSFCGTPVLDYAPLAGLEGADADAFRAMGTPLAMLIQYELYPVRGTGMFLEQLFGLDFYGFGDADVPQNLGVRVPAVLT